ncbi:hypothetical protein NQ315_011297 [Exocentrus adspersus]|uniref:Chromo domain-containing protein n=1 Tax=Exocentrus adspersus TaxID=1586481 RepID=A0AAV8VJH6_9CUCU|nr:hypothetical protein NQ315_011297 [Exocentrus adspersus]
MSSLKQDVVNEIHKPTRRNFLRRRVQVRGFNDLIQADLVEMIPYARENSGYRYILVVINVFSNTYSNLKASVVERVNRTLKNLMWKQFSLQGNYKWLALLPKIVHKYNNTRHRTIKMKPSEVNNENELILLEEVYGNNRKVKRNIKAGIFKKGDYGRISKYREAFAKGEELQKTPHNDVYLIEKVVRRKGNKLLVKWLGMHAKHNSWIDKTDMVASILSPDYALVN